MQPASPSRRPLALLLLASALAVTACSTDSQGGSRAEADTPSSSASSDTTSSATPSPSASASPTAAPVAAARPQLPRGGRQVFPAYQVVMHYGTAGTDVLGVLGEGTPEQAVARLTKAAAPFAKASGRKVQPAFELITTIARSAPGKDGLYSDGLSDEKVQRYLDAARKAKMLLVLDFQPGKADLLDQVKSYEKFLKEPDVGVALDPEWKLVGDQRPGRQIGRVSAAEVNRVSAYVATLRRTHDLPEKLFVLHQFRVSMLPDREKIALRSGLATVLHVDGFGTQSLKKKTYSVLQDPKRFHMGFKLFYDEDTGLMTPAQAMALKPRPELISYQ